MKYIGIIFLFNKHLCGIYYGPNIISSIKNMKKHPLNELHRNIFPVKDEKIEDPRS